MSNRPPTYDDANLLLRLYELRRDERMRTARAWFSANFKAKSLEEWQALCPPGSEEDANFRMVTSYWEMACSFVASGVLHPELFIHNSLEFMTVWERIAHLAGPIREMRKQPAYWRNLEAAAALGKSYMEKQRPDAYEAFASRWRP
jgi:hypothetical protein